MQRGKSAFTITELMIVVAIIGLLAVIAVPYYVRAREASQLNACVNNLRQIAGAMDQWAIDNRKSTGDAPGATDLDPYLKRTLAQISASEPTGAGYTVTTVGADPACNGYNAGLHPATI
jgi:prepilin-type N-terminal cleavage/methylation domain-containing protein